MMYHTGEFFSGRGNSAFEVADRIYGATNVIHMIGRSRVRLSWSTHYVGDLRLVQCACYAIFYHVWIM